MQIYPLSSSNYSAGFGVQAFHSG